MAHSGTLQSIIERRDVTDARIDIFPWMSDAEKPGVPFSMMNPRIPSSARAQTNATSAIDPLVIQVFSPFNTHSDPAFFALVNMPAWFDPTPGSVKPKHP